MANSRLSFAIVVKLLTGEFNKGANRVKSQLLAMQRNFLALASAAGAGAIGLTNFVSKAIEVAKATTQASVALKNVSGSTEAFVKNQQWLVEVAKRYGVEINSLTMGFAKFKAAADISSMSLEDQRKIFESVARASVAFGLSAEDQRGIFMALSQMMSKNKVMAEELRLQLAERMPVAIQAMAKAAGVTVNELDALMKQGKVMAADVLPKFADALNELIPNIDTNNLNKSLVDLSNAFTNLVKGFDIEGKFKGIVDAVTGLLSKLGEHTTAVAAVIKGAFWAMVAKLPVNTVKDLADSYDKAVSAAVKAVEGGQRAIKRLETQRALLKEAETAFYNAEESKKAVTSATTAEEIERIDAELNAARQNLKKRETEFYKAQEAQKKAATKASAEQVALAAQQGATGWTKAVNVITFSLGRAWQAIKAMFKANIWTAAITAVITLADKIWQVGKNAKEAARAVKALENIGSTDETAELNQWRRVYGEAKNEDVKLGALAKINALLGTDLTIEDDINAAIDKRISLLQAEAKLRAAIEAEKLNQEEVDKEGTWQLTWNLGQRKKDLETAKKARKEAEEEVAKLSAPNKNNTTTTPRGVGSPVKVEVVNLDADDFGDFEDIEVKPLVDSVAQKQAFDERQAALARGAWVMSRKRDTSNDWKMSPAEIKAEELAFNRQQLDDLIDVFRESGGMFGEELTKAFAENTNLADALRATEIQDALTSLQKEMDDAIMGGVENAVSNIDGIVNAFDRLTDAMDEDATAWERLMAVWELFSSTTQSVIGIIESIAKAKEISAQIEAAAAARNMAANTGEAASEVGKDVAKQSGGWAALVAVPAAISAILAAFAMIPKFAKGGIVGGNSTQGDKVLARLNSGEGVLTPEGLESLHDAANPRNTRKVEVTGVLKGRGRDLMAVIDTETKYKTRTR
jgi:tape measure domain-containing protein